MSNPFTAPTNAVVQSPQVDELTEMRELVAAMRFPHLLIGGLVVLFSLVVLAVAGLALVGGMGPGIAAGSGESVMMIAIALFYAVFGVMYGLCGGLLLRSGIAGILSRGEPDQILVSLRAQLWFWRLLGVYVLGFTALYVLFFIAVIGAGMFGAAAF